jgi:hypothetical protein
LVLQTQREDTTECSVASGVALVHEDAIRSRTRIGEEPIFPRALYRIAKPMDRRLFERTAEIARRTDGFDDRKLPKSLRIAIDSSPLEAPVGSRIRSTSSSTLASRTSATTKGDERGTAASARTPSTP